MSVLVVLMPLPARAAESDARGDAAGVATRRDTPWRWLLSEDGRQVAAQGTDPPDLWPRADTVAAVVPPQALSWAPIDLPKVPAGRMRAGLAGALEDALLEDAEQMHFALPPQARPGRRATAALLAKAPLLAALQAAEAAGQAIDRVVPAFEPTQPPRAHFQQAGTEGPATGHLVWADEGGVAAVPLAGDGARALIQQAQELLPGPDITWTCTPAAAVQAEAWTGRPVPVVPETQPWLEAAGSAWELRQFDLAPGHRGLRLGREAWRQFKSAPWRPVRLGLAGAVVVNVLGLQVWSWQQEQAVETAKQAQAALLKSTHPQIRVVLDAPLQMQRELDRLRQAAGQPGEADLEAALSAAASAWPAGLAAPQALRYERGQLTLSAAGLSAAQQSAMGERLQPLGWSLAVAGATLTLTRRAGPAGRSATP
ncbi:MAG: type II secretion system protein GspL [Betaproteobacteria bacterium]|jgi:general secretion pathway protein L